MERNIEILDALLELSKSQNWAEKEEIGKLQEKYLEIKKEVEEFNDILRRKSLFYEEKALLIGEEKTGEKEKEEKKPVRKQRDVTKTVKLNKRQEKILQLLGKREKMQVKDFQVVLPSTTKRTLRRDLSALTEKKIVKRVGSGNTTYYSKKDEAVAGRT